MNFTIPLKTKNLTNIRTHWGAKAKDAKAQRTKARMLTPAWDKPPLICVHMVRFGVGTMDDDGLRAALKHVRDGIADRLKVDDGSRLIEWRYSQMRCRPGEERVEVDITYFVVSG